MHIPFFSLARQWNNLKAELEPAIKEVLDSQQYIGGPFVETFEKNFAAYTKSNYAIACNSGTDALWIALDALQLKPHSLVLTTPFSFIASSSEIVALGAIPVFIDIEDTSYNISASKAKVWLEKNAVLRNGKAFHTITGHPISGIVAVNIFGQCADYKALEEIAKEWNLWIVEDAAQSIGASYQNKLSGNFASISCFSFYPTKNLGAFGDGGMMTTNDPELATTLKKIRNHGRLSHYEYQGLGRNSRLDGLQASILNKKLASIESFNARRAAIASLYDKELAHLPFIKTPKTLYGKHTFHQYSVQIIDEIGISYRDQLSQYLAENNIETRVFYPQSLSQISFLTPDERFKTACPIAEQMTKNILALPIWPELTDEEVAYVCTTIRSFPYAHLKKSSLSTSNTARI